MQLDDIHGTAEWFGWVGGIVAVVFAVIYFLTDRDYQGLRVWAKRAAYASVIGAVLSSFIPTTKVAASMVIIPAVANNPNVQREAGDLYQIAKEGLRNLAEPKK